MDLWNGSPAQVANFRNQTGITYPLCLNANAMYTAYVVSPDYSVVVDQNGIIQYKAPGVNVSAITSKIDELLTLAGEEVPENPNRFVLHQNYPNPFNPTTSIAFEVPAEQRVSLKIYDSHGRLVRTLLDRSIKAGRHEVSWDGRNHTGEPVGSGVYLYVVGGEDFSESKKMILLR